jgi:hypothetical protein
MEGSEVLVIGETPSLGRSIIDLLESGNVRARYVLDVGPELPMTTPRHRTRVVIAACNGLYCATARRWARGELPNVDLVVVGSRDPTVVGGGNLHVVPLPLMPAQFLALVRRLLESPDRTTHESTVPR